MNKYRTRGAVTQLHFWTASRKCPILIFFGEKMIRSWVLSKILMHTPAVHYIRESTCSRAFKKSCRYSVKDSLTKLLLLLGEKKNNRPILKMSHSTWNHILVQKEVGKHGWSARVLFHVLTSTTTWIPLHNFKWDPAVTFAAVICSWCCVSLSTTGWHPDANGECPFLLFSRKSSAKSCSHTPGLTHHLLHCWSSSLFNDWPTVCTGRECCYLNRG